MGIHWQELVIILVIVLVLFGPKRLPEIGSSLGKGIRGFKDSMNGNAPSETPSPASITASTANPELTTAPVAVPVPVEVVDTKRDSSPDA